MTATKIMTIVVTIGVLLTTAISMARQGALWHWESLSLELPAEGPLTNADDATAAETATDQPAQEQPSGDPVAVAEVLEFDFGVEKNQTKDHRHTFQVRNDGVAPLRFVGYEVSCDKCTFVELPDEDVPPGGTSEVVVRWNIDTFEDHFRQSASIRTNDPAHPMLRFVISGKVVRPLEIVPRDLVLSNVRGDAQATAEARLYAYFSDDLKIIEHRLVDASTAANFDVQTAPLAPEDLPPGAKSGAELTLRLKPGLALGPIQQTLELSTNLDDEPKAEIAIKGQVTGAISVIAKGWDQERNMLEIGSVQRSTGGHWKLTLVVRGPQREGLQLEPPEQPDADVLKISYGEPSQVKGGATTLLPVSIDIPKGSRLVNHMGGTTGRLAEVVIPTNKPELGRVKLLVKFAVVDD